MTARRAATLRVVLVAGGLAAALLLALALEREEQTVPTPPGAEARANPFLAAERFLDRMGLPTRSRRRLLPLPATDRLVLLGSESRRLGARQTDALLAWITAGGHLIVGPRLAEGEISDETHTDPLLAALGVGVYRTPRGDGQGARDEFTLELDGSGGPARVRFYVDHGLALLSDEDSQDSFNLLFDDYGAGRFYVLNDTDFLQNEQIGDLDHARLLWNIVEHGAPRAEALVIFGGQYESLLALLLRHAWPALLAGAAFLGALLWRGASRIGPLLAAPVPGSRSLMDHVDAAGHFFWRQKRADVLLNAVRSSLLRRAGLRRPQLARMDEALQATTLAAGSGLAAAAVEEALFGICPHRRDVYTRWMRTLVTLRRSL